MYKFVKKIKKVTFAGKEFDDVIVCHSFQYFPERKEVHIGFTHMMYDEDTNTFVYNNDIKDQHYFNIPECPEYYKVEEMYIENGFMATLEYVWERGVNELLRVFYGEALNSNTDGDSK